MVGADRIAANGDTANKIGTYALAVLARENRIPFYVAAPAAPSTTERAPGEQIAIEQRSPDGVLAFHGARIAPEELPGVEPRL